MIQSKSNMTKRDFLKLGTAGICGLCLQGIPFSLLAGDDKKLWKWSKEASFYHSKAQIVYCELCPHECILSPGERGICRSKVNIEGKYYSVGYGNPCTANIDPIEKKPIYHFLPTSKAFSIAVAGCNFRCLNCQNWTISQVQPEETNNLDMFPEVVVKNCLDNKCESIAYTYSEPNSYYDYMYDTAKLANSKGIKNLLISNGYIYEKPLRRLTKYINAANINLKSFKNEIYKKLNGGTLAPILNTLKVLKEEGVWLEITNLVIPTWTDDFNMIKEMCNWLAANKLNDCPLHFLKFMPLYKLTHLPITPVSTLEKARKIALDAGMKYVYLGNVPGHEGENTFCPKCKKQIIERKGFYILENNMKKNSCKFCGETIAGVWEN
ncbi:MAG: AmmeMemoRadiSam system radical SAM enzyme [Bacteroidetes bacterium]|nr:AmmeMemoRadiSam system radical SAM enzyme [Bacteroidota bacterium]